MAQQRRGGFKRRKKVDYIAANKIEYVDYQRIEPTCPVFPCWSTNNCVVGL